MSAGHRGTANLCAIIDANGLQIDGRNYIVPGEFEPTVQGLGSLIPIDDVVTRLTAGEAQVVVMLDACRDNPLSDALAENLATGASRGIGIYASGGESGAVLPTTPEAVGEGLAELEVGSGTLIAFATQPGNVALDGEGDHSPFTEGLLAHMDAVGKELSWVLRRTRASVMRSTGGKQVPWDHSSLLEPFVLNRPRATPPPP